MYDECFATIVAGCLAAEGVMATPFYGCFAVGGVFVSSSVDTYWPSMEPLADDLPRLALWSPLWLMLCCREHVGPPLGGCLAAMVAWSSLADALPPLLLDVNVSSLGECFATTALSLLWATLALITFIAGTVVGLGC